MSPAVAIGASLDGVRVPVVDTRVAVEHGHVRLGCRWPHPASALRGAVVAALGGARAHVDLHGHQPDGTGRQSRATVCYRVDGDTPVVWAYGPRAVDHLRDVARIGALDDPAGRPIPIDSAELAVGRTDVGLLKAEWCRYWLATPYFPSTVAYARRPRGRPSPERDAWAGQALASSIRMWLADLGLEVDGARPVHVQLDRSTDLEVRWRDSSDAVRWGFTARFVSNAILPDGLGLGQHVSEGWGEVRCATP